MELAIQSSCLVKKQSSSLLQPSLLNFNIKTRLSVKATESSSSSSSSSPSEEPEKPTSKTNVGFGSSTTTQIKDGKKKKGSKGRATIIRRTPLEKPAFVSKEKETKTPEQNPTETAFLLTWFGLGLLIITEGLVLAASGLFPEEWDKFFVKYLYPSFTPTVFLFVAGTVVYGVLKYLEGEKMNS
ncbi:hypothetical protein AQUCO_01300649v1 [Aquilegia coerulea]|uniref:Protein LOW PSII ACCUMULATION 2, chloroplastic n=1 Tax=Aquilegia coerulea TaxID=218851 RepID=A0A2G5E2S4_AQUCA|nr:hypothetical protein AQUCO_01300649v1 [Aquilegia coerulea]